MGRGRRQGSLLGQGPSARGSSELFTRSEAQALSRFIERDLGQRRRIEIFADPGVPRYIGGWLEYGGARRVQGEVAMRNYLGRLWEEENLPAEIEELLRREKEWTSRVLASLPEPSLAGKLRGVFRRPAPEYLQARWISAIREIDRRSPSGKRMWSYLAARNGSRDHHQWFQNAPREEEMWEQLLLVESQRAVQAEPRLQELQTQLLREEGRLRDEAALDERDPTALFLMPHSGWAPPSGHPLSLQPDHNGALLEEDRLCGMYYEGKALLFGETIDRLSQQTGEGESIDNLLHAARHELIHGEQPEEEDGEGWQWDVREALTEALNVHRSYSPYQENPGRDTRKSMPVKTSYQFEVQVLENMLLDKSEDFGELLEDLNQSSFREIDKRLDPLFGGSFREAWHEACQQERELYS